MSVKVTGHLLVIYGIIACIVQTLILVSWIYKAYYYTKINKIMGRIHSNLEASTTVVSSIQMNDTKLSSNAGSSASEMSGNDTIDITTKSDMNMKSHHKNIKVKRRKHLDISKSLKNATLFSILFSCLYCYWSGIGYYFEIYYEGTSIDIWFDINFNYSLVFISTSRMILYYYYLRRLYITFQNSSFDISKKRYKCIKWLLIYIFIIITLLFIIVQIIHINIKDIEPIWYMSLGLSVLFDNIIGICLLVVFIRKLNSLNNMDCNDNENIAVKEQQKKIKNIAKKLSILVLTCVVSTIITLILYIFFFAYYISLLDLIINSLCLLFSFQMYEKPYNFFCYFCKICCIIKE